MIRDVVWTLASATTLLPYPLLIEKGESPDFDLRSAVQSIGVEIIEAIPPNLAQAVELQTRFHPNAALDALLLQWGAPKLTSEQIRTALEGQGAHGAGWGS